MVQRARQHLRPPHAALRHHGEGHPGDNGAGAFCKVNDRGPTVATGRLIDLSMDTFARLAAPEAGLIDVTIEW